ncbi:hypothetical protein L195_g006733 [Trifolium pratense]|uniref:Uncharacterized protein n=1 Tax=Trifolium pratense TaxID=57577 RepID=A0A2K3P4E7_TRIPR|nr:hypothetical protein L195_g006733 [Trifolium pratense]
MITMEADKKGLWRFLWMTEETLSSTPQQNNDPNHVLVEAGEFDSRVDEYIFDEEKKAGKSLSLETIMRFERLK